MVAQPEISSKLTCVRILIYFLCNIASLLPGMNLFEWSDLLTIALLVLLEGVLSGDNALVLAVITIGVLASVSALSGGIMSGIDTVSGLVGGIV